MILSDYIDEWSQSAPWILDSQVEQDLILSRIIIEIFSHPKLAEILAFRGGTALYKLFIKPAPRYSEDIDLVQVNAEPIGNTLSAIKEIINPILGKPKWKLNHGRATLYYRFQPESMAGSTAKIKIEINTREHFSVFDLCEKSFSMQSRWYTGNAMVKTYQLNELLGTKLRALFQRKKGRDLFDIWKAQAHEEYEPQLLIHAFQEYMAFEENNITRAIFEENLYHKLRSEDFRADIVPILAVGNECNMDEMAFAIQNDIIALLPGKAWAGLP